MAGGPDAERSQLGQQSRGDAWRYGSVASIGVAADGPFAAVVAAGAVGVVAGDAAMVAGASPVLAGERLRAHHRVPAGCRGALRRRREKHDC